MTDIVGEKELPELMVDQVVVHPDRIEVALYQGAQAVVALQGAGVKAGKVAKPADPKGEATAKPGFVWCVDWLPTRDLSRTLPHGDPPLRWRMRRARRPAPRRAPGDGEVPGSLKKALPGLDRAHAWAALLDGTTIATQADLARHLGVSRARVSQVLGRLRG